MTSRDRPISAVLQDIVGNVQDIVRAELRLAKTEVREELSQARSVAILMGMGIVGGLLSTVFVLLSVVYALSEVMPPWASALIVALAVGALAAIVIVLGLKRLKTIRAAPRTAASLKENVAWARQLTK